MDLSIIPQGDHCYKIVKKLPGEVLSLDIERFGKDLREYPYFDDKEVLCPYWYRTNYGTVGCKYLEVEFLDDFESNAEEMAARHFKDKNIAERLGYSALLSDEVKICNINLDE